MQPVARIAVCVLLCLPVAAQTPGEAGSGQEVPAESPGLPNAPSSARDSKQSESAAKVQNSTQDPAVNSPYQPLTNHQKFNRFLRTTVSPYTFASAALNATWLQINGEPYAYGGGMSGWGMRFGTNLADAETRAFFSQFLFPVILNQDPRYFPRRQGSTFDRISYAATRVLVIRSDNGKTVFNSSYLLGVAFSRAASTAYIPEDQRNFRDTMLLDCRCLRFRRRQLCPPGILARYHASVSSACSEAGDRDRREDLASTHGRSPGVGRQQFQLLRFGKGQL